VEHMDGLWDDLAVRAGWGRTDQNTPMPKHTITPLLFRTYVLPAAAIGAGREYGPGTRRWDLTLVGFSFWLWIRLAAIWKIRR